MGQKSLRSLSEDFLGIRAKKVEVIALEITSLILYSSTTLSKYGPIKSNHSIKNSMVQPSGPGIFERVEEFTASFRSGIRIGRKISSRSTSKTNMGNYFITLI